MKYIHGLLPWAILSVPAFANNLSAQLSIESGQTDNAVKTQSDKYEERQDTYQLSLNGDYQNTYLVAFANYSADQMMFSESSQKENVLFSGEGGVEIGKEEDPAGIKLDYTRRTLLRQSSEPMLRDNYEGRGIFSIVPNAKIKLSNRDTLIFKGNFSDINYQETESKNSEQKGADIVLSHRVNALSNVDFSLQSTSVSFDYFDNLDYSLDRAIIGYFTKLRQVKYAIQVGYDQTRRSTGADASSPSLDINVSYDYGLGNLSISARQYITDSSTGDANTGLSEFAITNDANSILDKIKRRSLELFWSSEFLCARCTISIAGSGDEDKYIDLGEIARRINSRVEFGYQLTRKTEVYFSAQKLSEQYSLGVTSADYDLNTYLIGAHISISKFSKLNFIARREQRDAKQQVGSYTENFIGAGVVFEF